MKRWGVVVILSLHMLIPATASAQNNARDGIAAPPGTILSVLYGYHYFGDYLKADGKTVPMDKVDLQGNYGLWREVFYFQVGSFVANAQFLLPFGNASLDLNHTSLSTSGIGDPSILTTFWFINRESTKTYLSFTPWFYFPLGNYSNDGLLTMGANRWRFKEELNFTRGFEAFPDHLAFIEVTAGADFFTANNDYGPAGGKLEQDPVYSIEAHLSYDLTRRWWVSADFYQYWGGAKTIDGVGDPGLTRAAQQVIGGTVAFNVSRGWQVLFQYRRDVAIENGVPDQTLLLRLLYATDFNKLVRQLR